MKCSFRYLLALVTLLTFVSARGLFWLALAGVSPIGEPSGAHPGQPAAHPCACTGAPICQCPAGSCCSADTVSLTDSVNSSADDEGVGIGKPKICGSLGLGAGPHGETPALAPHLVIFVALVTPTGTTPSQPVPPWTDVSSPPPSPPPR